ncbi:hypothetical protein GSI_10042 [Ganoderma sinense ZZ0214-1]|uniref:Uncharacterized protein n=1 Tax=Ganoderma sinense ZZ0214-1 TaxID=1077348 RepID=A0A2G8RZJ3_9APHY|nr:hypothetical protein GSI_10042 [Ganoderma sinense ZZ0214-1]
MPSEWTVEFTTSSITAHAWGSRASDEFGSTGARLSVIVHKNGAVFLAIVGADPSGVLQLNFGRFWLTSTYKRWTSTAVTYRGTDGGIYLVFPCASDLDGFEECCDRVLPSNLAPCPGPSAQDLYDLGAIPAPRIVGDFLLVWLHTSTPPLGTSEAGSEAGSEVGSEAGSEVGSEVGSEAGSEVGSEAGSEVDSSVSTLVDLEDFILSLDSSALDELANLMPGGMAMNNEHEQEWFEVEI